MHPIEVEKAKKVDKDNDHHNQGRSNLVTIHPAMQDDKHHFAKQTHEKTCPYPKMGCWDSCVLLLLKVSELLSEHLRLAY
jgi:hypothetical protein